MNQDKRDKLADELLDGCPAELLPEHTAIADAIRRGDSLDDIMGMGELDNLNETYLWLQFHLTEGA